MRPKGSLREIVGVRGVVALFAFVVSRRVDVILSDWCRGDRRVRPKRVTTSTKHLFQNVD